MPVSMDGAGSGVSVPSAARSNCMKTWFQISIQPVPSATGSSLIFLGSGASSPK